MVDESAVVDLSTFQSEYYDTERIHASYMSVVLCEIAEYLPDRFKAFANLDAELHVRISEDRYAHLWTVKPVEGVFAILMATSADRCSWRSPNPLHYVLKSDADSFVRLDDVRHAVQDALNNAISEAA